MSFQDFYSFVSEFGTDPTPVFDCIAAAVGSSPTTMVVITDGQLSLATTPSGGKTVSDLRIGYYISWFSKAMEVIFVFTGKAGQECNDVTTLAVMAACQKNIIKHVVPIHIPDDATVESELLAETFGAIRSSFDRIRSLCVNDPSRICVHASEIAVFDDIVIPCPVTDDAFTGKEALYPALEELLYNIGCITSRAKIPPKILINSFFSQIPGIVGTASCTDLWKQIQSDAGITGTQRRVATAAARAETVAPVSADAPVYRLPRFGSCNWNNIFEWGGKVRGEQVNIQANDVKTALSMATDFSAGEQRLVLIAHALLKSGVLSDFTQRELKAFVLLRESSGYLLQLLVSMDAAETCALEPIATHAVLAVICDRMIRPPRDLAAKAKFLIPIVRAVQAVPFPLPTSFEVEVPPAAAAAPHTPRPGMTAADFFGPDCRPMCDGVPHNMVLCLATLEREDDPNMDWPNIVLIWMYRLQNDRGGFHSVCRISYFDDVPQGAPGEAWWPDVTENDMLRHFFGCPDRQRIIDIDPPPESTAFKGDGFVTSRVASLRFADVHATVPVTLSRMLVTTGELGALLPAYVKANPNLLAKIMHVHNLARVTGRGKHHHPAVTGGIIYRTDNVNRFAQPCDPEQLYARVLQLLLDGMPKTTAAEPVRQRCAPGDVFAALFPSIYTKRVFLWCLIRFHFRSAAL